MVHLAPLQGGAFFDLVLAAASSGSSGPIPALVSDIIAHLHFAYDPMQQAGSDHFMPAKFRRNVLKKGIAVERR